MVQSFIKVHHKTLGYSKKFVWEMVDMQRVIELSIKLLNNLLVTRGKKIAHKSNYTHMCWGENIKLQHVNSSI